LLCTPGSAFLLACASAAIEQGDVVQPLSIDSIQEIDVTTSGASVACHFVEQPFGGQVLYRYGSGDRVPGIDVSFYKDSGAGALQLLNIRTDDQGRFDGFVTLVHHYVGDFTPGSKTKYLRGRMAVLVRAPGCRDKELQVDDGWRARVITLRCPERQQ